MDSQFVKAILIVGALCAVCLPSSAADPDYVFPEPVIDWAPREYVCYRTETPVSIDGFMNEESWLAAAWTEEFVDIEGDLKPAPRFRTRAKMLWDDQHFYVGAELDEPDIWATLTARDAVIYHDNDFEVFIDPDGDTHEYYELEINAHGTEWDLLLVKPYRDGGPAVDSWDIQGLRTGIFAHGTINDPGDTDLGWNVEIAIPWSVLDECAHRPAPPVPGDQWRVNFSRVEWRTDSRDGRYEKTIDPATGRAFSEDNWVWSPQGLVAMHYPEMWGFVQFSERVVGDEEQAFAPRAVEPAKWALMQVYYRQRTFFGRHGAYSDDLIALDLEDPPVDGVAWPPEITVAPSMFEVRLDVDEETTVHVSQDGHLWHSKPSGN